MHRRTFLQRAVFGTAATIAADSLAQVRQHGPATRPARETHTTHTIAAPRGLKVSPNGRYLADARTGDPFFLLADTAWNLNALNDRELVTYVRSRAAHGFSAIMFCLDFFPQSSGLTAYGQCAYVGPDKTQLNPRYFAYCDRLLELCAKHRLYAMVFTMWGGKKAGIMNRYTPSQLHQMGIRVAARLNHHENVILVAGGESSPPYIDVEHVDALGTGLKKGCDNKRLVSVHPCGNRSASYYYAHSEWLDFFMCQGSSSIHGIHYDMTQLVTHDMHVKPTKPTMMAENYYDSGTHQPPKYQRRNLYLSVFAGAMGCAYGHDALWQMTPHTAKKWMLESFPPGVATWSQALNTPAVSDLHYIRRLLYSRPYFSRIPDQRLIARGEGRGIQHRIQATRDGSAGNRDATYIMAYQASPVAITLDTRAIAGKMLSACWFDPATGRSTTIKKRFPNTGSLALAAPRNGQDMVVVVDDASKAYQHP